MVRAQARAFRCRRMLDEGVRATIGVDRNPRLTPFGSQS
jgi:hypothetical protein